MASRQGRSNRIYNWHAAPWQIDCRVTIGASGAPTLVSSSTITGSSPTASTMQSQGVKSITRLNTGIYQIQLDDNYTSLLQFDAKFTAGVGGTINMGSLVTNTIYQILTLGTSTQAQWHAAGVPAGITAAVGVVFKAAGAGAGNGTTKLLVSNSVSETELLGIPDLMLNNQPFTQGNGGGYINFQCLASTAVGTFTGSALGAHNHDLLIIGGQAASTTNDVAAYAGPILGKEQATNATIAGSASATNGGVVAASAGTPAGTFAGTAPIAADPTNGSTMYIRMLLSNSSVG